MKRAMAFVVVFLVGACLTTTNVLAGGHSGKHGKFGHDPFFMLIHKLDLTDDQKATVAGILSQRLEELRPTAASLATARVKVFQDALRGNDATKDDCVALGSAVANLAQLHAAITQEIITTLMPSLSDDQKATLQNMQEKIGSRVDAMIDARFTHLEKWIAKHSK
jgi:hypothetical protein